MGILGKFNGQVNKKSENILSRKKTTKVRTYLEDNKLLTLLSLKVSARRETITTTAEVIHAIIEEITESGNREIDEISQLISDRLTNSV